MTWKITAIRRIAWSFFEEFSSWILESRGGFNVSDMNCRHYLFHEKTRTHPKRYYFDEQRKKSTFKLSEYQKGA